MADQGNYLAQMLSAGQSPGTDVIGNLNKGMQFGQNVQNIPVQNMFRQQKMQEMEKQKALDVAIKQYGQTGDIKGVQAIDPEIAARISKATDYINSQPSASVKAMEAVSGEFSRIWPMVNSQNWSGENGIKARIMKAHPDLPKDTLPPDNATDDQLKQFGTMIPMFNATLEGLKNGPKVLKPNDLLMGPQGPIYQAPPAPTSAKDQSIIEKNRALIGKYGADVELKIRDLAIKQEKLDWEKTKPEKGTKYNEATAYDKAVAAADRAVKDDEAVKEMAKKRLIEQDPEGWKKMDFNARQMARDKIMPEVRKDLWASVRDEYLKERRKRAGVGGGGKQPPQYTPEQLQNAFQQKAQQIAAMPDGPGKATALQQLEAWRAKNLTAAPTGRTSAPDDEDEEE